jgi:septal ring factor EnvC (AmiA/AmiB activator)
MTHGDVIYADDYWIRKVNKMMYEKKRMQKATEEKNKEIVKVQQENQKLSKLLREREKELENIQIEQVIQMVNTHRGC